MEIIGEENSAFALTLMRGVGLLGKEDLLLRPGRPSGIKMAVPDSQLRGTLQCRFSLWPYSGTPLNAGVAQQARSWLTPVQCYNKIPWDAMKLNRAAMTVPEHYSLLTLSSVGWALSALKKAEDRPELIIRLYNPSATESTDAQVAFNHHQVASVETGMDEQALADANRGDVSQASVRFLPCQSRTFSVSLIK